MLKLNLVAYLALFGLAAPSARAASPYLTARLIDAIHQGDVQYTRVFIDQGADVNGTNRDGASPLTQALIDSSSDATTYLQIVQILIDAGGDVNRVIDDGQGGGEPIFLTALRGLYGQRTPDPRILNLLLSKAAVGAPLSDGETPATLLASYDDVDALKLLFAHGADPNATDRHGDSPFFVAIRPNFGQVDLAEYLVSLPNLDVSSKNGNGTPLLVAAGATQPLDIIQSLVKKGANVSDTDSAGMNILMAAAENARVDIVEFLLSLSGVDVNTADHTGKNPLDYATTAHNSNGMPAKEAVQILGDLIAHGANPNSPDKGGTTPLMYAIAQGVSDSALYLLNVPHIDLMARDANGNTALHLACQQVLELEVVQTLLNDGAALNVPNNNGDSPLLLAVKNGSDPAARYLITVSGIDVKTTNREGETVLHVITAPVEPAKTIATDVATQLISLGAPLNAKDVNGNTALMRAVLADNLDYVNLFIGTKGIDLQAKNGKGQTAMALANALPDYSDNKASIVDALKNAGAK